MGQTWSVPAIGFVTAANNVTTRRSPPASSSSPTSARATATRASAPPREGTTHLRAGRADRRRHRVRGRGRPHDGDALRERDRGRPRGLQRRAAVVPAATVASTQSRSEATRVYFGDIHGRVWRYDDRPPRRSAAARRRQRYLGRPSQPLGVSAALLNYRPAPGRRPSARTSSWSPGNDNRIFLPTEPADDAAVQAVRPPERRRHRPTVGDGVTGRCGPFTMDFPALYRGNAQPATAFNDAPAVGRVFFAGRGSTRPARRTRRRLRPAGRASTASCSRSERQPATRPST